MSPLRPAILFLVLLLAACAPSGTDGTASVGEPTRAVTLLLGFRPDVQFAPFYVAQQEGYFADAGLTVEIRHEAADVVQRLVADGQAEFGVADATDVMIARTAGLPIKYVSTLYNSFPVALIGEAGTVPTDPSELAGASIGTPGQFGSSWHALLALLDAGGLTAEDVTVREYPQFNQVDGLSNGDVELITGFRNNEPLRLEARGTEVDLLTVDEIAPLPGPGMIVGDELLEGDPALVEAFVTRWPPPRPRSSPIRTSASPPPRRRYRRSRRIPRWRAPSSMQPWSCGPATGSPMAPSTASCGSPATPRWSGSGSSTAPWRWKR